MKSPSKTTRPLDEIPHTNGVAARPSSTSATPKSRRTPPNPYFLVLVSGAVLAFVLSFPLLSPILLSFLLTALVSLALNPLVMRLRSFTGGRKAATTLLGVAVLGTVVLTGWALFGPIRTSIDSLSENIPQYLERLQKPLLKIQKQALLSEKKLEEEVTNELLRVKPAEADDPITVPKKEPQAKDHVEPASVHSGLGQVLQGTLTRFTVVAFSGVQIGVVLTTVFFGVVFSLMNPIPLVQGFFGIIPSKHHAPALAVFQRIAAFVPNWALSTLCGMLTIGVLVFLFMWPIFGVKDAFVLALVAGVLEAIPFIGPLLSAIPSVLLALSKGGAAPVWVLLSYAVIQALENNLILPVIMSRGMKLPPVAILFSTLLCVATFGVLGVLLAAPMVAIGAILLAEIRRLRGGVPDAELEKLARKALHERGAE